LNSLFRSRAIDEPYRGASIVQRRAASRRVASSSSRAEMTAVGAPRQPDASMASLLLALAAAFLARWLTHVVVVVFEVARDGGRWSTAA